MAVVELGLGPWLRSCRGGALALAYGPEGRIDQRVSAILSRPDGLGSADPGALFDAVLSIARARTNIALRRRWLGDRSTNERGLEHRRQVALSGLDIALTRAIEMLGHQAEDLPLRRALGAIQPQVRERARTRARRIPARGRARLEGKGELQGRLVALGATSRDARYLLAHIPVLPPARIAHLPHELAAALLSQR